jgi:hypothetical protein
VARLFEETGLPVVERRQALKRGKPPKRGKAPKADPEKTRAWQARPRKRIPAESAKHRAERGKRTAVREEVLKRDRRCRAFGILPGPCSGQMDVHEVISRARWTGGYLVPENCQAVCRGHHDYITTHPEEAEELGYLDKAPQPGLTKLPRPS